MTTSLPRDDNDNAIQGVFRNITSNRKVVATAATAVQLLTASTEAKRLDVTALFSNTKNIAVGDSSVAAVVGSEKGVQLSPGSTYTFFITDVSKIYIDSIVNGDGVAFNYFT